MEIKKMITAEIIFVFATVLIFRSVWLLLDKIPLMKEASGLWPSLILGIIVATLSMKHIVKKGK